MNDDLADNAYDQPIDEATFSEAVLLSKKVGRYRGRPTIEIIIGLCDDYKVDIDQVPSLINARIKKMLEVEGIQLKTVKGRVNKNRLF